MGNKFTPKKKKEKKEKEKEKKGKEKKEKQINDKKNRNKQIIKKINSINPQAPSYEINIDKNIQVDEKIENYQSKANIKDERCITSFTILKDNKLLITFKGGILKIYECILDDKDKSLKLNEIIRIEGEEYCFNYGIELHNGNLAVCSEDSTIQIIQLNNDEIKENEIKEKEKKDENKNENKDKENEENEDDESEDDKKYTIIQKEDFNDEPLYIIKQLENKELVLGGWNFIYVYAYLSSINKFELISKVFIDERTFSLLELYKDVIVSSQCYIKQLMIYNIQTCQREIIKNIESNENPNILCKYDYNINNKKDIIVFVASYKGVSIVSINKKCLLKFIQLNEEVSSICPFFTNIYDEKKNKIDNFSLICGIKKRVFGQKVNFYYNLLQIGILFNLEKNDQNISDENNYNITTYLISEKERAQLNAINTILNTKLYPNTVLDLISKQMILTNGSEDKSLNLWEIKGNIKK
jgi:hypothetical protein